MLFQVSEFLSKGAYWYVSPEFSVGAVPIAISVETFPKAPIPGTELDVPRLAAPRGPARGRARANLRDLTYRYYSSSIPYRTWARAAGAMMTQSIYRRALACYTS